jgi:hypothetical protein
VFIKLNSASALEIGIFTGLGWVCTFIVTFFDLDLDLD